MIRVLLAWMREVRSTALEMIRRSTAQAHMQSLADTYTALLTALQCNAHRDCGVELKNL